MKQHLLDMVDRDREEILTFLQGFVRCPSPNPPGDTRAAGKYICDFLEKNGHDFEVIAGIPEMPNIVAAAAFAAPGKHLVLNGHIDVFPVESPAGWTHDPWSGHRSDGMMYGRGVADMKTGTTASIFTYHYLSQVSDHLAGKLSLVAVSDEETFGPWGTRYLFEHRPELVLGYCALIGEPTSSHTTRFGEKGILWMRFSVTTKGAHGAYTHASENAIIIAGKIVAEILEAQNIEPSEADNLALSLDAASEALDLAYGKGASGVARRITANIGTMSAGVKVNMVASSATFDVDFRIPLGIEPRVLENHIDKILKKFPQARAERLNFNPPNWSAPDHEMVELVRRNAASFFGVAPTPVIGIAATDARLWRYHDVPAIVFGPAPHGMASHDEFVSEDEAINVVKTHLACAWDYLSVRR